MVQGRLQLIVFLACWHDTACTCSFDFDRVQLFWQFFQHDTACTCSFDFFADCQLFWQLFQNGHSMLLIMLLIMYYSRITCIRLKFNLNLWLELASWPCPNAMSMVKCLFQGTFVHGHSIGKKPLLNEPVLDVGLGTYDNLVFLFVLKQTI